MNHASQFVELWEEIDFLNSRVAALEYRLGDVIDLTEPASPTIKKSSVKGKRPRKTADFLVGRAVGKSRIPAKELRKAIKESMKDG